MHHSKILAWVKKMGWIEIERQGHLKFFSTQNFTKSDLFTQ